MVPNFVALFSAFSLLCLIAITAQEFEEIATNHPATNITTTAKGPIPFSVRILSSNVPNTQYAFDAVGMLQLYLEKENSTALALPKFLKEFRGKHVIEAWKLSSACQMLDLPAGTIYIKLYESYTKTEINIFA